MSDVLKKLARVATLCGIAAVASTAAGCVIETTEPVITPLYLADYADLEVRWTINGSTNPRWCDELGIETWQIEVSGRDARVAYVDCRADFWRTQSEFYGLDGGDYRVRLTALDFDDFPIVSAGARINDLYSDGGIDVISIRIEDSDFFD